MKYILNFCLSFFLLFPLYGFTIHGGVSYTIETARLESFNDIKEFIPISNHTKFFVDRNYKENLNALSKKKFAFIDRNIVSFSEGSYCVTYKNKKNISYIYNSKGELEFIQYEIQKNYPQKTVSYDIEGKLDSVCLTIKPRNQYIFDSNKKLIAHWIGNNCYNEQGELVMTRE